jgi:hypothetical protein
MKQPRRKTTRHIQKVLYALKKEYGFGVTFYNIDSENVDYKIGTRASNTEYLLVKKTIILPRNLTTKFEFDLTYIAAGKNMTYGGLYQTGIRKLIVDRRDVGDFEIRVDGYFTWEGKRYQIAEVEDFELNTGWLIVGRVVEGAVRNMIVDLKAESPLTFSQQTGVA